MLIVDVGFSSTKWVTESGKRGKFPSIYRIMKTDTEEENTISLNGTKYIIGENALIRANSSYLRFTNELVKYQDIFAYVACKEAEITDEDLEVLVVGLPYAFWVQENEARKHGKGNAIDEIITNIKKIKEYPFKNIYVFPQGLGGIKLFLNNTIHHEINKGRLLGVDIGFNTVISTLYDCGAKKILYGETYYKKGVIDLINNYLFPNIKKLLPERKMLPHEINAIFQSGYIQHGFDRYDITQEIVSASQDYINYLLDYISGDMKENFGQTDFHTAVFFGGGSRMLSDINIKGINVNILQNPEYANAEGFLVRALEIQKENN